MVCFRISAFSTLYMRLPARARVVMSAPFRISVLPLFYTVMPALFGPMCSHALISALCALTPSILYMCLLSWGSDVRPFRISALSTLYICLPARVVMSALFESQYSVLPILYIYLPDSGRDVRPFRASVLSCSQFFTFWISVLSCSQSWGRDVHPFRVSVLSCSQFLHLSPQLG